MFVLCIVLLSALPITDLSVKGSGPDGMKPGWATGVPMPSGSRVGNRRADIIPATSSTAAGCFCKNIAGTSILTGTYSTEPLSHR